MKRTLIILALFFCGLMIAQQSENRFQNNENAVESADDVATTGPGGPDGGDDLPIDDYVPLLAITAVGIIIYSTSRRNKISLK